MIVKPLLHPFTWWNWSLYIWLSLYHILNYFMFGRGFSSTLKLFQSFTPQIDRTFPGHMNTVIFKVVFSTLKVPTVYTSKMKEGRWHIPQRNIWGILVQKKHSVPIGFYFSPCVSMLVFMLLFKGSHSRLQTLQTQFVTQDFSNREKGCSHEPISLST